MPTDLFDTEDCDDSGAMLHVVERQTDRRSILSGAGLIAASALCEVSTVGIAPAGATAADAELLRLGASLEEAWRAEAGAWTAYQRAKDDDALSDRWDALCDATQTIVGQIEKIQATTLAGLVVKARACSWCHSGEPFQPDFFDSQPSTDSRLAASVFRDLITISGKPVHLA